MMKWYGVLVFMTSAVLAVGQPQQGLSEQEMKNMGLSDKEIAEVKQILDTFTNMSPEEKQKIEELGRRTEQMMRDKNLDPNNFDDVMKFMETEGMLPDMQKPQKPSPVMPAPRPMRMPVALPKLPEPVPAAAAKDTRTMLNDFLKHLARLRQKVRTRDTLQRKLDRIGLELNEFTYYLNILNTEDLIKLLSSKEFSRLRYNLEQVHQVLMTHEPNIHAKRNEIEASPYELLGISSNADQSEIDHAFEMAKQSLDPEIVGKQLEEQGLNKGTIKKAKKQARLAFAFYEEAYNQLSNPEERAALDESIQQQEQKEKRSERASNSSFEPIYQSLTNAFFSQTLLDDIRNILEKYKPQELAKAQAQLQIEERARVRMATTTKIPPAQRFMPPMGNGYEQFYQELSRRSFVQPRYPVRPSTGLFPGQLPGAQPAGGEAPKKEEKKKKEGKEHKEDAKKKKEEKKPLTPKERKQQIKQFASLENLEQLLEQALEREDTISLQPILRSPSEEVKPIKVGLEDILQGLDAELVQEQTRSPITQKFPELLKQFVEELKLPAIEKELKKLVPAPRDKGVDGEFKELWNKKIYKPYGPMIEGWHSRIFTKLHYPLHTGKQIKDLKKYGLEAPLADPWKKEKEEIAPVTTEGLVNLASIRDTVHAIHTYFTEMSTKLGIKDKIIPTASKPSKMTVEELEALLSEAQIPAAGVHHLKAPSSAAGDSALQDMVGDGVRIEQMKKEQQAGFQKEARAGQLSPAELARLGQRLQELSKPGEPAVVGPAVSSESVLASDAPVSPNSLQEQEPPSIKDSMSHWPRPK